MLRAFWTWNPVSAVSDRPFDEPHACANNAWLFDHQVWTRMFEAMSGCGFNAIILANTHPFPFMVDLPRYPQARVIDGDRLAEYAGAYHWIFQEARRWGLAPYVLFFSIYFPDPLLRHMAMTAREAWTASDFAIEYTGYCVRELLKAYPELAGIVGDASENIEAEKREVFLQQAVLDAVDDARPDAHLMVRGYWSDPSKMTGELRRRNGRPITWTSKYTFEHLVHTEPDPIFRTWMDKAGPKQVAGEFWISNFEPWTCFSFDTIQGILANLERFGCAGFSMHPLSMYQWPFSPDSFFDYQWERDRAFYRAWGGARVGDLRLGGEPAWVSKHPGLLEGFQAASRIMELLALYIAGDRENQWHPQFCSIKDYNRTPPHLLTIEDMLHFDDQKVFQLGKDWWRHVTGQRVVHFAEHIESGTPAGAYGPEEFIDELADLSSQALVTSERALDAVDGDRALESAALDAFCMGKLGAFYAARSRAALSRGRGDDASAVSHLHTALDLYRELAGADSRHRRPFRVLAGRAAIVGDWSDTLRALEAEYRDALAGEFRRGTNTYLVHRVEGGW